MSTGIKAHFTVMDDGNKWRLYSFSGPPSFKGRSAEELRDTIPSIDFNNNDVFIIQTDAGWKIYVIKKSKRVLKKKSIGQVFDFIAETLGSK